ncbi:MAG: zinc-ribbon domain-containing protein [Theionarchaea archaeon]|nr:zinc-ribbon domain-containing protein [Theionarchaea archaeon]
MNLFNKTRAKDKDDRMICPQCGIMNRYTSKFCRKCGSPLNSSEAESQSVTDSYERTEPSLRPELIGDSSIQRVRDTTQRAIHNIKTQMDPLAQKTEKAVKETYNKILEISLKEELAQIQQRITSPRDNSTEQKKSPESLTVLQESIYCPRCGKEMPPDSRFCSNCGHRI